MGTGCPGGLVQSWLLAVPGLATLLSDCVRSNPTSEWAEPGLSRHPNPHPTPRAGLTLQAPEGQGEGRCAVDFAFEIVFHSRPRQVRECSGVEFQASVVIAVAAFWKNTAGLPSASICLVQCSEWCDLGLGSAHLGVFHPCTVWRGRDWLWKSLPPVLGLSLCSWRGIFDYLLSAVELLRGLFSGLSGPWTSNPSSRRKTGGG